MHYRQFMLYNYEKDTYFPLYELNNFAFLINPSGIEASFSASTTKYGEYTTIDSLENDIQKFQCVLVFEDYTYYQKFLFFCNNQALELQYKMPKINKVYRQRVQLVYTGKTELTRIGTLEVPCTFLCETPFFINVEPSAGIGQVLDPILEYRSTFGQYVLDSGIIKSAYRPSEYIYTSGLRGYGTGQEEVQTTFQFFLQNITLNPTVRVIPFRVEITGPCENPRWSLLIKAIPYVSTQYNVVLGSNDTLIVDSLPSGETAVVYNKIANTYTNVWLKQTIAEKYEPFMKMFQGENILTFDFKDDIIPPTTPVITVYETSIIV